MMGGYGMGGFGSGGIFMVLWWVLVIAGILALLKWSGFSLGGGERDSGGNRALDILKERYARGEIDEQEFVKKKRELG